MSEARWITADVFDGLATLADGSVHSVITSPPYWRKRRYLPAGHPDAEKEIGQEASPGEFLATLLRLTDELWRVLRDDGTIWINLGDTAANLGGAGGDYNAGGNREGQNKYGKGAWPNDARCRESNLPRAKSVCWIPELFGASLAYGRNLLTGEPCRQWITRPPVTWCKPAPTPGEIIDKFREATELIVWAAKQPRYYFDLDAVREPPKNGLAPTDKASGNWRGQGLADNKPPGMVANPLGVPPLTWWVINTSGYDGAHFATFPPELITRPVIASCPSQACSVCGKGRGRIHERSYELDTSRPQAARAMELARTAGLTPAHFAAITARGIADVGRPEAAGSSSGRNTPEIRRLADEAKAALGGYFREFVGAPMVPVGWVAGCCDGASWVPGTILDPFGGSGTTAAVATGHGRNCISIELDARNHDLARERVGMFLTDEVTA